MEALHDEMMKVPEIVKLLDAGGYDGNMVDIDNAVIKSNIVGNWEKTDADLVYRMIEKVTDIHNNMRKAEKKAKRPRKRTSTR